MKRKSNNRYGRAASLFTAALVVLAFDTLAFANSEFASDPDDPGTQMALDIVRFGHGHRRHESVRVLTHHVEFESAVDSTEFYQDFGGLQLYFDVNRSRAGDERTVRFRPNPDGTVSASMYSTSGAFRGFVNWWRPDDRTVTIEFRKSLLKKDLGRYSWRVDAIQDAPCEPGDPGAPPGGGCRDDTARLVHRL